MKVLGACVALVVGASCSASPTVALKTHPANGPSATGSKATVSSLRPSDVGISFTHGSSPAAGTVSEDSAIQIANLMGQGLLASGAHLSAQYGTLTDVQYADIDPNTHVRTPRIVNRKVWLVTYSGAKMEANGPGGGTSTNSEFNVVVDAITGQYLEGYSYR